jgi:hypothetical protein
VHPRAATCGPHLPAEVGFDAAMCSLFYVARLIPKEFLASVFYFLFVHIKEERNIREVTLIY